LWLAISSIFYHVSVHSSIILEVNRQLKWLSENKVLASITGDGPNRPVSSRSTQLGKEDIFWESSLGRGNEM